jgi:putative transposase
MLVWRWAAAGLLPGSCRFARNCVTARVHDGGVFRAFQAILQPTAAQEAALARQLDGQRELYNAALEERIGAWRYERRSVSRFEQFGELTGFEHPVLEFGVCPARGTLTRLARAFDGFYRRCRRGETPGFPRFKSAARWDSVEYPDRSCWRSSTSTAASAASI